VQLKHFLLIFTVTDISKVNLEVDLSAAEVPNQEATEDDPRYSIPDAVTGDKDQLESPEGCPPYETIDSNATKVEEQDEKSAAPGIGKNEQKSARPLSLFPSTAK